MEKEMNKENRPLHPILRPMTEEDLGLVMAIENDVFKHPWTSRMMSDELMINERSQCVVATIEEDLVGYYTAWHISEESNLNHIAVRQDYRKRGIGRCLLRDFLDSARSLGSSQVFLEVAVSNKPALHLYESMGFERIARRKNYYAQEGLDAYVMKKEWTGKAVSCDNTSH